MNFFEHQNTARKKTTALIGLLITSVVCLIAITVFVIGLFLYYLNAHSTSVSAYQAQQTSLTEHFAVLVTSPLSAWIALGVIVVVTMGSLYKLIQLSNGGQAVAEALGGRVIDSASREPMERKILNVVEEMAIASGNPVPPVYLLEEDSINAFAAGLDRRNAVIGVTRGCINILSRDELQGVIAHEFSHIHNGDMRLNLRLVAVLHGILLIGLIGHYMTHGSSCRHSYGYMKHDKRNKQAAFGLALVVIGYGGTFFGNIIKAAVSRQREFLADASAVQFTRNPEGIGGALKKIGGYSHGSLLTNNHAPEFSHLYFGQGIKTRLFGLTATHPPLPARIKRIQPRWSGEYTTVSNNTMVANTSQETPISHFSSDSAPTHQLDNTIVETISEPNPNSILSANRLIGELPAILYDAVHQAYTARALVYGMLVDRNSEVRTQQLSLLKNSSHPVTYQELLKLVNPVLALKRRQRLPLLHLCIPALKQLSQPQYQIFKKNLALLIKADKNVSLFEWCLYKITIRSIETKDVLGKKSLSYYKNELHILLSATALAGKNRDPLMALNLGLSVLNIPRLETLPCKQLSLSALDQALSRLEKIKPLEKPLLLKALIQVINADTMVHDEEKELFRAVADTLNCPVPPLESSEKLKFT